MEDRQESYLLICCVFRSFDHVPFIQLELPLVTPRMTARVQL